MLTALFRSSMLSPARQHSFRRLVMFHVLIVAILVFLSSTLPALAIAAQVILVLGIVEGASLIGWRLTQLPKSQALEFVLVSATPPRQVFLAELLVGAGRFALVQFAGLPILVLLMLRDVAEWPDVLLLVVMPLTWGLVAGVALTAWIYEPLRVRRIGEMLGLFGVLVYLVVGVLAAENLQLWLQQVPEPLGEWLYNGILWMHTMNPFGIVRDWFSAGRTPTVSLRRALDLELFALASVIVLSLRAGARLLGHFHDRHYKPIDSSRAACTEQIGDHPLTWWAVRRVMEYSGRVNLYLAGGFGLAYAAYIIAGDSWPPYIGRGAFILFDSWDGPAMVSTAMAVMACVPAVYQYGLWDSNVPDRCRRLELLLLTDLTARDYASAAAHAAWSRGRGYFVVAALLWTACAVAGTIAWYDAVAAAIGSAVLYGCAFVLGFRGFATGRQSNGMASLFTLGLPLLLYLVWSRNGPAFLVPTALPFLPMKTGATCEWFVGLAIFGTAAYAFGRRSLRDCDRHLRAWYDAHQGAAA